MEVILQAKVEVYVMLLRKLQHNEKAGSYFVIIPANFIKAAGWKKGDLLEIDDFYNDEISIRRVENREVGE